MKINFEVEKVEKYKDFSNEVVTHVKKGNVEYLTFNALEQYKEKIMAIVTLKHGGVSEDVYNSLNFRMSGNDKKENVLKNLNIICDVLDLNSNEIYKGRHKLYLNFLKRFLFYHFLTF